MASNKLEKEGVPFFSLSIQASVYHYGKNDHRGLTLFGHKLWSAGAGLVDHLVELVFGILKCPLGLHGILRLTYSTG